MAPGPRSAARVRECLLVVAAAGYGKTTALEPDPADSHTLYLTAAEAVDRVGTGSGASLTFGPAGEAVARVVVDDLDRVAAPAQSAVLRGLAALPDPVLVSLASRRPLTRTARGLLRRIVVERNASDLALAPEDTARVLRDEHGVEDAEVADTVHKLTAGWPALVHLAGDALSRQGAEPGELLAALSDPGTAGATWIQDQVLAHLPRNPTQLLDAAIGLGPISAHLCQDLAGVLGLPDAERSREAFAWLTRSGLLVSQAGPIGASREGFRPVAVLAAVIDRRRGRTSGSRRERCLAASSWYAANRHPLSAARMLDSAGDLPAALALIEERSEEMLAAGGAEEVVRLVEARPLSERSDRLQLILGDARRMAGDASGAARAFEPLVRAARASGTWTPGLAWRLSMVSYMTGEFPAALEVCDAALSGASATTWPADVEAARLHACRAGALFMLGEVRESAVSAARALAAADEAGDERALAAGHIAAAMVEAGARRESHLRRARAAAESVGDVVQLARVLVNEADALLEEASYAKALAVSQRALRAAELGSPPGLLTIALNNVGEALLWLGRYEDAALYFERSVRLSRRAGLSRTATGLCGLADIARALGRREQSRMGLEEAVELSRDYGEMQVLVPALAGLTRVLLDGPDPALAEARAAAEEAQRCAPPELLPQALVARGWVALAEGDPAMAQERAAHAIAAARDGRSAPALADSLELAAAAATETPQARASLQEALALWEAAGARPSADRVLVLLGRLPGAEGPDRVAAREAARRLVALGVQVVRGEPVLPAEGVTAPLHVRVLGGFEVKVAGRPVPLTAWRSRQARTLVKMLAARRGRPIPRAEVCETLWPDDEPARTAHRLSVLLSVVRTVLDPARAYPPDYYLQADLSGVSIDTAHVTVDALDLLRDAAYAAQLARDGDRRRARELLAEVDAMYRGDAFDDEPYEDWADALREEVRAAWLRSLRESAELSRRAGEPEQAVSNLVRLLAADPYDESAHRLLVGALVGAGRHGEARRAFDRWTQAMHSIDAPLPNEGVLRADPSGAGGVVDLTRPRPGRLRPADSA